VQLQHPVGLFLLQAGAEQVGEQVVVAPMRSPSGVVAPDMQQELRHRLAVRCQQARSIPSLRATDLRW
jgi:hypothetical protein